MAKYFFTLIFCLCVVNLHSQIDNEDILFTVDSDPVYASEFVRIFNKNLDLVKDESQKDVDQYLKLFINYKLKLKEAQTQGLDDKTSYLRELETYKKQLAGNFLTNTKVTDELVIEAYDRLVDEIKASHILIKVNEGAPPADTLKAYNDLLKLRDRVLNEGYKKVQQDVHNGQTIFAEDLGYFSAFKMVYDFENAAYSTNVDEVSMPFKTKFGYHIVKVFDKRKSRGERTVAHIMIANTKKEDTLKEKADVRINELYAKLQQGEDFESLAKQFSDDKSSAKKGGKLPSFGGGKLSSSEFEDAAFAISNIGDISKPFKTDFGWHIIKLYEKKPIESFDALKAELQSRVKRDTRSQIINESLINSLKKQYNVEPNESAISYFVSILTRDYYNGLWKIPEDFIADQPLFKIEDKQYVYKNFADFIIKNQRRIRPNKALHKIVVENYNVFLEQELKQYQEDNLETENEEFANIVGEYRDGLLLFDLMESEIWNAAKNDSIGLQNYYQSNSATYYYNERIDAVVASSTKKKTIKTVAKLMKEGKSTKEIKELVNFNGNVKVIFSSDIMDKEHQALPKNYKFSLGISDVYKHNGAFVLVQAKQILPKSIKLFEDVKGKVISDFQNEKERLWLIDLSKKYNVELNENVLSKVKTQIEK